MTFDFDTLCSLAHSGAIEGAAPRVCGAEGAALTLLAVLEGQCLASGLAAAKGAVAAAAGPLAVVPVGACAAVYACLAGEAARRFAAGLPGAACLPAGACPGVPQAVHQLAEAPLPAHEASALGYGALCRLAAALAKNSRVPPLVAAALEELQTHYAEVYGVDELAGQLGVSKSHLIRVFTASVGISPGRCLTQVRIENARRLLAGTTLPLDVVAGMCGFSGGNYLCKVFKKESGLSPGAWRRMAAPVFDRAAGAWEEQLYL